jgi:hypothetical protein
MVTSSALWLASLLLAGDVEADTYPMPTRYFALPLRLPAERQAELDHVRLHVSVDRGKSWQHVDKAAPAAERFTFLAPQDGLYWFIVQPVSKQSASQPPRPDAKSAEIIKVQVQSNGNGHSNGNGNGNTFKTSLNGGRSADEEAEMRQRLEQAEKLILSFEKRIEEMELRARMQKLERRLAELEKKPASSSKSK